MIRIGAAKAAGAKSTRPLCRSRHPDYCFVLEYRGAVELAGQRPGQKLQHAADLIVGGRFDRAIQVLQRHLERKPADPEGHLLLAEAFSKHGDASRALEHATRAARGASANPLAHSLRAACLLRLGQPNEALAALAEVTRLQPDGVHAWANLGIGLLKLGRASAAIAAFERAVALAPGQPKPRAQLASAHQFAGNFALAIRHFEGAAALAPGELDYRIALANAHRLGGDPGAAIRVLEDAGGSPETGGRIDEHLGYLHLMQGDFGAAARYYREALARNPAETNALLGLSRLEGAQSDAALRKQIDARLSDSDLPEPDRISLLFALGNLFDREDRHDEAMTSFLEGNRRKRAQLTYDPRAQADSFARIKTAFSNGLPAVARNAGNPSGMAIFVLGMPRSGTTLVEQILASHPEVQAGGELRYVTRLVQDWPDWPGGGRRYPEDVAALRPDELRQLGQRYLDKLGRLASGRPRVTDKMPFNFQHLGLIASILPNARIVHCRRDAMDVCVSNFTTLFSGDAAPFSYDLEELARYYRLYEDLMAHWQAVLEAPILDIHYEDLVAHQEEESRRLLEFCGLTWSDAVLAFQDHKRPVMTASSIQVRKALYSTAVGKWRRYEASLGPLKCALRQG